ncbi:MAG: caspase family protein [Candidatus Eisenbacteria bacterium]
MNTRRIIVLLALGLAAVLPLSGVAQDPRKIEVVGQKPSTPEAGRGARWAIVVGLDQYRNTKIPPLNGAVGDAKAIAAALIQYAEFDPGQVFLITSEGTDKPTASAILDKLAELRKVVKGGDMLLFYFAGHGVEVDGRRYLLTYETEIGSTGTLRTSALHVSDLMQDVEALPLSDRIIMVDACRDDPINPGGRQPNLATSTLEAAFTLQSSSESGVRATFLSCKRGQSAYEWGEKGRGFFSYFIEKGLSGEAAVYGKVTVTSLAGYLNENVPQAVRQQRGKDQTPFADLKGEALTLVRGEKMAVNPEAARTPVEPETRVVYGMVKDSDGLALGGVDVSLSWGAGVPRGAAPSAAAAPGIRTKTDEDGFFKADVPAQAIVDVSAGRDGTFGARRVQVLPAESGKKVSIFLPAAAHLAKVPERGIEVHPVAVASAPPETTVTIVAVVAAPETTVVIPLGPKPPSPAEQAQELAKVAQQSFLVEDFDQAEQAARGALELDSRNTLAKAVVANCLAVYGVNHNDSAKLATARELASSILNDNPGSALARNALGLVFYGTDDVEGARSEFQAAREIEPGLSVANANLGQIYFKLKQLKDSEKAFRAAIKSRPDAAVPYNGLAQVLLAQNHAGDAVKASREAISRYELRDVYLG